MQFNMFERINISAIVRSILFGILDQVQRKYVRKRSWCHFFYTFDIKLKQTNLQKFNCQDFGRAVRFIYCPCGITTMRHWGWRLQAFYITYVTVPYYACWGLPSRHCPLKKTFCSNLNFSNFSEEEKFSSLDTALHLRIFFGTRAREGEKK